MKFVKDLMVPIRECETVNQNMTVCEAFRTLERTQDGPRAQGGGFRLGVLLVLNKDERVVGKLDHTDIVASLDPSYWGQDDSEIMAHTSTAGLTPALLRSLTQRSSVWTGSLDQRARTVLSLRVRDCMCTPTSDECVLESDLIEVAIHKLAVGRHQSLLVTGRDRIVGMLMLGDVVEQVAQGCANWNE